MLARLIILLCLLFAPAAVAREIVVQDDMGGDADDREAEWRELAKRADITVRIDGECVSACAYVLGIMPKERVCVTRQAVFGFHMATDDTGAPAPEFTREVYARTLPASVQAWLARQGPLSVRRMVWLPAHEVVRIGVFGWCKR